MSAPVKIPADVELPDKVLAGFTARQVCLLAATGAVIYLGWLATRALLPAGIYVFLAAPLAAAGAVLALARRDGVSLDELARAALAYRLRPHHHHNPTATAGAGARPDQGVPAWVAARAHHTERRPRSTPLSHTAMPAREITTPAYGPGDVGLLDLGGHGVAVVAACSTVNFALRTETEQAGLIECFARLLHAQTGPLQILVRAHPVDLTPALSRLAHAATTLNNPALRGAAAEHHQWLAELASTGGLLARQVLIVLREPTTTARHRARDSGRGRGPGQAEAAAQARLVRRLAELRRALAPADVTVTALDPAQLAVVLATSTDPTRHLPAAAARHAGLPGQLATVLGRAPSRDRAGAR